MAVISAKMYGASTTTADAVASMDVAEDGVIEGALFNQIVIGDASGEGGSWELSFASVSAFTTNDTRASLATVGAICNAIGGGHGNTYVPMDIPVSAGERLYLHTAVSGTPTGNNLRATVYLRQRGDPARSRRANFR